MNSINTIPQETDLPTINNLRAAHAVRAVQAARENLQAVIPTSTTEYITRRAHELAELEARLALELRFGRMADWFMEHEELNEEDAMVKAFNTITKNVLLEGPDDSWSGRGNDLKRAIFDAKRDWVSNRSLDF